MAGSFPKGITRWLLGSLCVAVAATPVWAEGPLPDGPLTLDQAVRMGLEQHPELAAARARLSGEEAGVNAATAGYRPRLYAEGILRRGREIGGANEGEFTDDSQASLVIEQDLYDFGERAARSEAARAQAEAARLNLFDTRQRRVLAIRRQFYDVLLADRKVQVWNEAMAVAFVRWDYGQGEEELGEISPVELARLESRFRHFRSNYREAQYDARLARVRLGHALGLEDAIPRDLVPPDLALEQELPDVQVLRDRAWRTNPRLIAARQRLEAARSRTEVEAAQRRPRIVGEVAARHWAREFRSRNDLEAAVRLEAPLYEGGRLGAEVEQAQAAAQQQRARWLQLRQRIEENIYDAYLAVQTWQEKRQEAETRLRYRKLKTDLARTEYVLELETDLGDSLTEQTRAEMEVAEAKFALAMAYDRLDALVGEPLGPAKEKTP
ncbi:MAG TPA: TolC family protein [Gammaproteobacteria bacterium]|nr:TolC family protein [Gammaproteobacteria bacterium]